MSLIDSLLLTIASTAVCIALPKLLSTVLAEKTKQTKQSKQKTLSQAPTKEAPTLITES